MLQENGDVGRTTMLAAQMRPSFVEEASRKRGVPRGIGRLGGVSKPPSPKRWIPAPKIQKLWASVEVIRVCGAFRGVEALGLRGGKRERRLRLHRFVSKFKKFAFATASGSPLHPPEHRACCNQCNIDLLMFRQHVVTAEVFVKPLNTPQYVLLDISCHRSTLSLVSRHTKFLRIARLPVAISLWNRLDQSSYM